MPEEAEPTNVHERRKLLREKRLDSERRRDHSRHPDCAGRADLLYNLTVERTLCPLLRITGLLKRGEENVLRPRMVEESFVFSRVPAAFDGFRILHLSDMHFREKNPRQAEAIATVLHGIQADLCVITGDYRFGHTGPTQHVYDGIATMLSAFRSTHGILAVLGNHDRLAFVEPLRNMGVEVLINENRRIERDGSRIWVAAVDDTHYFRTADLAVATEGIPPGAFTILLAHTPELALEAPAHGIDLYLCGHTHWGQIRLPWLGAVFVNSRCPRRFCTGTWQSNGMQGYTSAGLGVTDVPVRFNCPPSAALITLRAKGEVSLDTRNRGSGQ